jgi:dihydropteroate synthase
MNGANAVRAHDVKLHADIAKVADAVAASKRKMGSYE